MFWVLELDVEETLTQAALRRELSLQLVDERIDLPVAGLGGC